MKDASETRKTFVLVPGAWHGAWCWSRVTPRLQARGHRVLALTQTGVGDRSHLISTHITMDTFIQDVVNAIEWEDLDDVVLVGHSFAGATISGVADRIPQRLRHLVFLDALVLRNGETPFDSFPPEVVQARRQAAQRATAGVGIPPPDPKEFGVVDPADHAWVKSKLTAHPLSVYESPLVLDHPLGNGVPMTYIAVRPHYESRAKVRAMVQADDAWSYREMDAGHDAMVTSPAALAEILLGF